MTIFKIIFLHDEKIFLYNFWSFGKVYSSTRDCTASYGKRTTLQKTAYVLVSGIPYLHIPFRWVVRSGTEGVDTNCPGNDIIKSALNNFYLVFALYTSRGCPYQFLWEMEWGAAFRTTFTLSRQAYSGQWYASHVTEQPRGNRRKPRRDQFVHFCKYKCWWGYKSMDVRGMLL